jgi:N-acetylneuraminate synthase
MKTLEDSKKQVKERSNSEITIADRMIGPAHAPFIIAEMSGNHNQDLHRALMLVDAAADAGVDALKLQTYTADTLTLQVDLPDFQISDPDSLWHGQTLYQLYEKAYTPWEWHAAIFDRCRERGLIAFSSPFDASAVAFLEQLNVPAYKIASFELVDLELIKTVARTGKPMIMSTGLATLEEIEEAVQAAIKAGARQLGILKCTSSYPANPADSHLQTIPVLQQKVSEWVARLNPEASVVVGLSDHTLGIGAAIASVALGANIIEKHLTLNREDGGVDAAFSLTPQEFKQLKAETIQAHAALGGVHFGPSEAEKGSLIYRRSLYIAAPIAAGESLTAENLRCVRPGFSLKPKYWQSVLGRTVTRDLTPGDRLTLDDLI